MGQVCFSNKVPSCVGIIRAVVGTEEVAHVVPEASIHEVSGQAVLCFVPAHSRIFILKVPVEGLDHAPASAATRIALRRPGALCATKSRN